MSGKKIVAAVLCGVGALAVVFGACNYKQIANGVRKMTSSPEEYFRYVEEQSAKETFAAFGTYYDLVKEAYNFKEAKTYESTVTVAFGEGAEEFFEKVAETDVSELSKLEFVLNGTQNDGARLGSFAATVSVDDKKLLSGEAWYDLKKEVLLAQFPELSEQMLSMDFEEVTGEEVDSFEEALELVEAIYEVLPEKAKLEELLHRYWTAAISVIDDIETKQDELSAEGVAKSYTRLSATLDGKEVYEVCEAVIEEILEDDELEALVFGIVEAQDRDDAEEIYEEFCNDLEDFLEDCEEIKDFDGETVLSVWVDNTGAIVGRSLEIEDEAELIYAMPMKGNKFGYEASLEIEGVEISLKGEGKKQGNKISGEFQLKVLGERVLTFEVEDFDTKTLKKGTVNGTVTVRPLGFVEDLFEDLEDETGYSVKNPALIFTADAKKQTSSVVIENNKETILTITMSQSEKKGDTISVPKTEAALELEDETDFLQWLADSNLKDVLESLEDAGVPEEWLEEFDDLFDSLDYEIALSHMEQGEFQTAKEMLFALGEYSDASEYLVFCEAMLCLEAGDYEKAFELYDSLEYYILYSDSVEKSSYEAAERFLAQEKYEEAAFFYNNVYSYDDAVTKYYYATARYQMENGEYERAEELLVDIEDDYADAKEALRECRYQLGMLAMEKNNATVAAGYFFLTDGYKDSNQKLEEIEATIEMLQMPLHQIYPVDYKSYVGGVILPDNYLGIPMDQVTDADIEDYIERNMEGAFSTGELSEETKAAYYDKCAEEKYTYALAKYLLVYADVAEVDEETVRNKAQIDLFRLKNEYTSYGFEWEEVLNLFGETEEELLSMLETERRSNEKVFLICYAIAQKEGLEVTAEEYDYFVADFADDLNVTVEDFLLVNPKEVLDEVFLIEKAMLFLIENADIQ